MAYTINVPLLFYFETLQIFDHSDFFRSASTVHKSFKIMF